MIGKGKLLLLTAVAACAFAGSAHAGSYQVLQCQTDTTDAMTASTNNGGYTQDSCNSSGTGYLLGRASNGDNSAALWRFDAPTNTKITTFWVSRTYQLGNYTPPPWLKPNAGLVSSDGSLYEEYLCDSSATIYVSCPWSTSGWAGGSVTSADWVHIWAKCWGSGSTCYDSYAAYLYIYSIIATLSESYSPERESTISGGLYSDRESGLAGTEELSFSASDQGGGLYRAITYVDGVEHSTDAISANGGKCAKNSSGYFEYVSPCSLSATVELSLDTTELSEGSHTIKIVLEDAAGNTTTATEYTALVDNVDPPVAPTGDSGGSVSGTVQPGEDLVCSQGSFTGSDLTYSYQWYRDSVSTSNAISGATSSTYTVKSSDDGHTLICRVTATNSEGSAYEDLSVSAAESEEDTIASVDTGSSQSSASTTTTSSGTVTNNSTLTSYTLVSEANGDGASRDAAVTASAKGGRGKFSQRWGSNIQTVYGRKIPIRGQLLDDRSGKAIGNASLTIQQRTNWGRGKFGEWKALGTVKTDENGRYSTTLDTGPSRQIRIGYTAYSSDSSTSDTSDISIDTQGRARLKQPKAITPGKPFRFKAKLLGQCPRTTGVAAVLMWKHGSGYKTFGRGSTIRSKGCTITGTYRFSKSAPRGKLRVRLKLLREAGSWPFSQGFSNPVTWRVK